MENKILFSVVYTKDKIDAYFMNGGKRNKKMQ